MDPRPNFYEFLGLEPEVDDWEVLQSTLAKMRNRWTTARTHANHAVREKAQLGLSLIDEMEKILRDPVLRRREADDLRGKRAAAAEKKSGELDRLINHLRQEGKGCSEEQFERLVDRFRGVFDEAAIRHMLEVAGMPPGAAPIPGGGPRREFLDEQLMRDIDQRLTVCQQPDLYALFGVSPETPIEDLFRVVDQRYQEIVRVGKTDPITSAEKELAGIGQDLFQGADKKERYDNSLKARPMLELREEIEHFGAFGTFKERDFDALVHRAVVIGVDRDISRSYLLNYAEIKGWKVVVEPPRDPEVERQAEVMRATAEAAAEAARVAKEMRDEARRERERAQAEQKRRDRERQDRERLDRERRQGEARARQTQTSTAPPPTPVASHLSPPSGLHVVPIPGGFRLTWQPLQDSAGSVQYVVVRKRGAVPQSEGDGEFVSPDLAMARFDDTDAPLGEMVYYAVFSLRGEEISIQAAISDGVVAGVGSKSGAKWAAAALVLLLIGAGGVWAWIQPPPVLPVPIPLPRPEPEPEPEPVQKMAVKPTKTNPGNVVVRPKKPPKTLPPNPTVTVVGVGDSGIVDSFTSLLNNDLGQRGFQMVRPGGLLSVKGLLRQGAGEGAILQALASEDVHVLVWAEAREVGRRELRYLGRSDTAYNTGIEVHAFLVANQRGLGGGWREEIEHTGRNSQQMAEKAMLAMGYDLSMAIENGWQAHRQSQP